MDALTGRQTLPTGAAGWLLLGILVPEFFLHRE
jgi:hypothetical protein